MDTDGMMAGDSDEKEKGLESLDISPTAMTVITVAVALPVDLYITHLGDAEKGRAAFVFIAATAITIMVRWNLCKKWWFWAMMVVLAAAETYLLQRRIHWYKGSLPSASLMPVAMLLVLIQLGFVALARRMFDSSPK